MATAVEGRPWADTLGRGLHMIRPVAVIGAGPYGLSTAAHLRARGIPVRVFGSTMVSWHERMPAGMILKSTPIASNIDTPAAELSVPGLATFWPGDRAPTVPHLLREAVEALDAGRPGRIRDALSRLRRECRSIMGGFGVLLTETDDEMERARFDSGDK
ncbi:hypothetical protein GCM10009612_24670 [Streptomyces beijiangensis]